MKNNKKYNGWSNRETWCFHLWITNDEALYNLTKSLLLELQKEREIQQVDIDFGMVAHSIIEALHNLIGQMNVSNDDRYKPYVEGWMRLKEHTGDISKVDRFQLSDALMEFL